MKYMRSVKITIFSGLLLTFVACSTMEKNSDTPEGAFQIAEEFDKAERFDEAVRRYTDVKNKFPYSQYAAKAELAIADVHFKDESYVEAQVSYQGFKDLHPKHPQLAYVNYKLAMSFFMQLPSSSDKDLSISDEVLKNINEFLVKYPESEYAKDMQEKRTKTLNMLAEKEDYIGYFYFRRKMFDSAISRYEGLLKKYPESQFSERAISKIVIASEKIGNKEKASQYFNLLKQKYPNSKEIDVARKVLE